MSNRIDFYQSENKELSLPATAVSIFYDGSLCEWLELLEIVRAGRNEFSWARLRVNQAALADEGSASYEEIERKIYAGANVYIRRIYGGGTEGAGVFGITIFSGHVQNVHRMLSDKADEIELIAKDFNSALERVRIYGQRVSQSDGKGVFVSGADTVFNPEGKANASSEQVEHNGSFYTVFAADSSSGTHWSCAQIIDYLLSEYIPQGRLNRPGIEQLKGVAGEHTLRNLDVTGLSLTEALGRCCETAGIDFKFVPKDFGGGPGQAIVFYRPGRTREVELNFQRTGGKLSISRTNVSRMHSKRSFWPVTHKYIGRGDYKIYEATFELVKAWDPALEENDYDRFSPLTNQQFHKVKDVYRKWCLNEAGDYSGEPYNQGDAFDFSQVFQGDNYVHRHRRFWPMLTSDKQDSSLGYYLQVSYDGVHWWPYMYAFNNLLNECGIWLSSERLDANTWIAALKGVLRFRITASVISDQRLTSSVSNGPVNSTVPVVEHILRARDRFKYRRVSSKSIFANSEDETLGEPHEADDSNVLYEYVRNKAEFASQPFEQTDVVTPYLCFDYQPGDSLGCSPQSTDIFKYWSDNRSYSWIKRVRMDFRKQCTHLHIVRQRHDIGDL